MSFADHFSDVADSYARFRPHYPEELFAYLASVAPRRSAAWDAGTGSGQAACALAEYFDRVIGTDGSRDQLRAAIPHPRVEYRVGPAEEAPLEDRSVDLITVAQAAHWFDLTRFFTEVRRVARDGAVVALWSYNLSRIDRGVDAVMHRLSQEILATYWPPQRRLVDARYETLPFPFDELTPPRFSMTAEWTLPELRGYIETWSALRIYRSERKEDPLPTLLPALEQAWGAADRARRVTWDIHMRVGQTAVRDG